MRRPALRPILLATCLLAGGALLAACKREAQEVPEAGSVEARLRRGLVSIGDDEAPRYALDWQLPRAQVDPSELAEARQRADAARKAGHLYEDAEAAIPIYLALLAAAPDDAAAQAGLAAAKAALVAQGEQALQPGQDFDMQRAHEIAAVLRSVAPDSADTQGYLARVDAADRLQALLEHGEAQLQAGNLGEDGLGASTAFAEVLRNRPGDLRALAGLMTVEAAMIRRADDAAAQDDFERAERWLAHAEALKIEDDEVLPAARNRITLRREARTARLYANVLQALVSPGKFGALRDAQADIDLMREVARRGDPRVAAAEKRLALATRYGPFQPGQKFHDALADGGRGPLMVVVPHGRFDMGADEREADSSKAEWPRHEVRFQRGFAMARTETTVADYRRFVEATGHRGRADRRGFSTVYDERSGNFVLRNDITWQSDYAGRPAKANMPVLHVDVHDAQAYVEWLSAQSGHRYRLPHEAEFEYALRAGGDTRFPWGDGAPPRRSGNLTGGLDRSPSGRRWGNAFAGYGDGWWGPATVGLFRANAFGLQDLGGNVSEWVMDCWHQGYRRAPADGGAWYNPGCRSRVVRGASWSSAPAQARSAWRMAQAHDVTNARTGFRVVREI